MSGRAHKKKKMKCKAQNNKERKIERKAEGISSAVLGHAKGDLCNPSEKNRNNPTGKEFHKPRGLTADPRGKKGVRTTRDIGHEMSGLKMG